MSRIVYVNGRYVPYAQAAVHVEDRGFQFADAIYEVCEVRNGQLVDEARHMARLGALAVGAAASPNPCPPRRWRTSCARSSAATMCATASSTCR